MNKCPICLGDMPTDTCICGYTRWTVQLDKKRNRLHHGEQPKMDWSYLAVCDEKYVAELRSQLNTVTEQLRELENEAAQ